MFLQVGDGVENLYVDLQDGTKLLTLLNLLTGVKLVIHFVHAYIVHNINYIRQPVILFVLCIYTAM